MNSGKPIFAQIMDFVPTYEFRQCVERYHGNYKAKSFSCWDQFLYMAFAQLTYRESLRDIQACLRSAQRKTYHMGIRGKVSRNTLVHANQVRDWRIYSDFAHVLITQARRLYANDSFGVELNQTVCSLDSTTIDLCLSLFPWATFRKRKGAVKLHTLLNLHANIPSVVIITPGTVFQVDQAASPNQSLLWYDRKRGQDPNLDCHYRLCAGRYRQKTTEFRPQSLYNPTDFECASFRKNANFTGLVKHRRYRTKRCYL